MDSEMSTLKLQMILHLLLDNPSLKLFRDHDITAKAAISDIFGNFSEFTAPIINPIELSRYGEYVSSNASVQNHLFR